MFLHKFQLFLLKFFIAGINLWLTDPEANTLYHSATAHHIPDMTYGEMDVRSSVVRHQKQLLILETVILL